MTTKKKAMDLLEKEIGPMNFGKFLKAARTALDLTQEKMGRKLGVSKSVVCDIEKGRQLVGVKLAIKIAKKAKFSEKVAVQLCLQDQLDKAKTGMKVEMAA